MSTKNTEPRKPSARVLRGVNGIRSEMGVYADVKASEGFKREAEEIRTALAWIAAAIAKATGSAA